MFQRMNIKLNILILFCLAIYGYSAQINIPRVELMPNEPSPYQMRDWKQVSKDYDALVFDFNKKGQYLPLIWWDKTGFNYPRDTFGMPSYVGHSSQTTGADHESINTLGAVLSATLVGIDKSHQNGHDWVTMQQNYYNRDIGEDMLLNNPYTYTGQSFWYEIFPHIMFYKLTYYYPEINGMTDIMLSTATKWHKASYFMKDTAEYPNYDHTAFNLRTLTSIDNGHWKEPDAAAGIAWLQYMAYSQSGQEKYLIGANWGMQFLEHRKENPYYEVLLPYGAYLAARMNAEQGTHYDVEKLINWCMESSQCRRGWGVVAQNWGGYHCDGLVGSIGDGGGYAFAMNTFDMIGTLVPLVRYDDRFAGAIGKLTLNAANAARYFYPSAWPDDQQSSSFWKGDPQHVIAYEGLRKSWKGKSPYATGDPIRAGWGKTDLGLYGSSYVGNFGGIISTTSVEKILQLDCLKTDYFRKNSYPTYLYYNPFTVSTSVKIALGNDAKTLYDAVSNKVIKHNVKGNASFEIPADSAVLLVIIPADGKIVKNNNKNYIGNTVIDYMVNEPATN